MKELAQKLNKKIFIVVVSIFLLVTGFFVILAYSGTWGKTDIVFKIHINEQLVFESVYGESPSFAIWLENPENGKIKIIYVTNRAGLNDWEGKAEVPVALPKWNEINEKEKQDKIKDEISGIDAITGATPKPGYFITRTRVESETEWICWIEMNLAGDYNEFYKEFDEVSKVTDEFGSGQPAIVYKTKIKAIPTNNTFPEVVGMSVLDSLNENKIEPLKGITTALNVFDEIVISAKKPTPRIIKKNY